MTGGVYMMKSKQILDPEREKRIAMEIVVDACDAAERAGLSESRSSACLARKSASTNVALRSSILPPSDLKALRSTGRKRQLRSRSRRCVNPLEFYRYRRQDESKSSVLLDLILSGHGPGRSDRVPRRRILRRRSAPRRLAGRGQRHFGLHGRRHRRGVLRGRAGSDPGGSPGTIAPDLWQVVEAFERR